MQFCLTDESEFVRRSGQSGGEEMSDKSNALGKSDIYDARSLGTPKVIILGIQHMFAMFGSTVLVPMLTGLDVSTTLLFAGLGTLLFHLLTKSRQSFV